MKSKIITILLLLPFTMSAILNAADYSYIWSEQYPNYKSQIPPSDFTTADNLFRFTSERATGVSSPVFDEDNSAGLLYRLYADNTLRIESLTGAEITAITFVIGGNGHYKLANLTPSSGAMDEPYIGKDATNTFREYRLFWKGSTTDITFTVGHECEFGIDCVDQGKTGEPGTCMTKQMIITANATSTSLDPTSNMQSAICNKVIKSGHLLIEKDGKTYTVTGQEIK